MNGRTFLSLAIALLVAAAWTWTPPAAAEEAAKVAVEPAKAPAPAAPAVATLGKPAPNFTLTDANSKPVSLGGCAGKIVVLEWINPDCPVSLRHHKSRGMETLAEKYAAKGVVWLAVNSTNYWTIDKNKEWAGKQKLPYPILNDQPGDVGRLYEAKTTPDMRIIDAKGVLVYAGGIDDDSGGKAEKPANYVAQALDELLAGKAVSTPKTKPYGCSVKYAPPAPKAPSFTLADQNGKKVSLGDYAGKIVVLEWINPDCPISLRHHKSRGMETLAQKYAAKGVVWLAINSTNYWTTEKNKEWADQQKLPYPMLNDQPGEVGHLFDAKTTPDLRIVSAAGKVAYGGAIDDDSDGKAEKPANYVAKALDELLAGKAVSTPKTTPYGCTVKYAK